MAPMVIASNNSDSQSSKENGKDIGNIILNHDFSDGLHMWRPNHCDAFVVQVGSGYRNGLTIAVVKNRTICWQGLEQDITSRISAGSSYTVSACVGASGTFQGSVEVIATLKLVYQNSKMKFIHIGKKYVSKESWGMLEGSFSLSTVPNEVIFFLEGPPPGVQLLIKSVVILCSSSTAPDESKDKMEKAPMIKANNYFDSQVVHVEDGSDSQSSPEKYIEYIRHLQEHDAPVGGIGIHGHIDSPVGPIICSALDKLGILGLPIWFSEVDVSSDNEHVRADDLEVILREAYAHPAVEGIMLWRFWELFMSRSNVNAKGDLNETGRRYLALKHEWLSNARGHIDEQGQFSFSGFHGSYEVEVITDSKTITKKFVVDKGDDTLIISVDI